MREARSFGAACPTARGGDFLSHGGRCHRTRGRIYGAVAVAAFHFFSLGKYIKGPSQSRGRVPAEWFMAEPELGGVAAGCLAGPEVRASERLGLHPNTGAPGLL